MYEIRQYYIVGGNLRYHPYNYYNSFTEAYNEFIELYKVYNSHDIEEVVFVPYISKDKIESFVRHCNVLNKDVFTIYREEIK